MDPVVYLSRARFHQSVSWGDEGDRISFALLGAWPDQVDRYHLSSVEAARIVQESLAERKCNVVLYILPSGCSRYVGVLLSAYAASKGLCMLAIDRPGAGATPPCAVQSRIDLSTRQTIHVLQHLGIDQVDLFTHSAGWIYALELIHRSPSLFLRRKDQDACRIVFSSPFVPTSASGSALSLLPESLVLCAPSAFSVLLSLDKAVTWSAGFVPSSWSAGVDAEQDDKDDARRQANRAKKLYAQFHPPYRAHAQYGKGLEAWRSEAAYRTESGWPRHPRTQKKITSGEKMIQEFIVEEGGIKAATQDFLLCLGKGGGLNGKELISWIEHRIHQAKTVLTEDQNGPAPRASFLIVWAEQDGLIPQKGKSYLTKLMKDTLESDSIKFQEWIVADAGHDAPLASEEVMGEVFDFILQADSNGQS